MHNILVTGSKGQVGSELKELSSRFNYHFFFTNRDEFDITNKENIDKFLASHDINVIINCAAYTSVDSAEKEIKLAHKVNVEGVEYLAKVAKEKQIKLIHFSSDYVFDGKNFTPYFENETPKPNNIYGKTKLAGEKILQEINPKNSIIIRTAWLYSYFGENFVKTMLSLGEERDTLSVICDQVGTPTYARDLAKVVLEILPKIENSKVEIYHYSNEGVCSWYDFSKEIMRMSRLDCEVKPIATDEYPTRAKRPYYSLLNKQKIKDEFKIEIAFWKDSLERCLKVMEERIL